MNIESTLYFCDAQKNKACKKGRCVLRGGPCCMTNNPEFALLDTDGNPWVVTPKQRLEIQALQALIKLEKRSQVSRAGIVVHLNGDGIQSLIENHQLTINGARSMMGPPPIDTPCANTLLTSLPDEKEEASTKGETHGNGTGRF